MAPVTPAHQLFDLSGEVALVTGASSGLGARFAEVLAAHGAKVVAAARRLERLEALASSNSNIRPLALDVTDLAAAPARIEEAEALFGPLTVLVNNAGIAEGGRIVDTPPQDFHRVMAVNVDAVWALSQAFARRVIARGGPAAIINISSIVSYMVASAPASYAVSKAAVLQMTRAMALEWARHRIRVNAIAPGYISSEMTEDYLKSPAGEAVIKRVPQRRAGDASDLDGALLLLASSKASGFMTGASVVADGGMLLS